MSSRSPRAVAERLSISASSLLRLQLSGAAKAETAACLALCSSSLLRLQLTGAADRTAKALPILTLRRPHLAKAASATSAQSTETRTEVSLIPTEWETPGETAASTDRAVTAEMRSAIPRTRAEAECVVDSPSVR